MHSCNMNIKIIDGSFSVLKVKSTADINFSKEYTFAAITDEEISLVCKSENAPTAYAEREDGWRCLRIEGTLDFSLIGIIADISKILAENKIGIFVISTYNTDYVLTKANSFDKAVSLLKNNGYKTE